MRVSEWPRVIQDDIGLVVENQFIIGDIGESRDTAFVEKGWFERTGKYHPAAGDRIREVLGLPKARRGC
jgi:hypothetical protein